MGKNPMLMDQREFRWDVFEPVDQRIPVTLLSINRQTRLLGPQPVFRLLYRRLPAVQYAQSELSCAICRKQVYPLQQVIRARLSGQAAAVDGDTKKSLSQPGQFYAH